MQESSLREALQAKIARVQSINPVRASGVVTDVAGLVVESQGPPASMGDLCEIETPSGRVRTQVIGFRGNRVLSMPLDELDGVQLGAPIVQRAEQARVAVGGELLGRVLDGFGVPIDGRGPLQCSQFYELNKPPPGPMSREPIVAPLGTGVRAIDALLPCGRGQRVGIFGGSGVGKSTLLAALARHSEADVSVIALVGERNREVKAFIDENLGPEGLARSVVVAATSDRPAPVRVRATFLAATIAEYFRDQGKHVLLIMDSVTRLAMAQREIGLAAGEPPSQKGYTPSVFQMLPRVFERAGNFEAGSITGFYTVLVEADDMNDPIADAVRAVLDGHIVLSRDLASANHYPPVDVLHSVSRLASAVCSPEHLEDAARLRESLAAYQRAEDLINLGAYASGSNRKVDAAIRVRDEVIEFLRQDLRDSEPLENTLQQLHALACRL